MAADSLARRLIWRIGRKIYMFARGEGRNDPHTNGEYWLLERVLWASRENPKVLVDVGANVGDWSAEALRLADGIADVRLHSFEPAHDTRALLTARFADNGNVKIHMCAMSSLSNHTAFYTGTDGGRTNSLSPVSGSRVELVPVTTLDEFLLRSALETVVMVKIDAEGSDALILLGGKTALSRGVIEIIQFEYNWRWLLFHQSLRDVFDLIADKPYKLAKLLNRGLHFYESWHPELDRFFECNYALIRKDSGLLSLGSRVLFDDANAPA